MSRIEVVIRRHHEVNNVKKRVNGKAESSTVGLLTLYKDGVPAFDCFTIENGGESTDTPNQDKRIMPGEYQLEYSVTSVPLPPSLNRRGIILKRSDNPNFIKRRIFIHMGNYPQDTEGCILLNGSYNMVSKEGFGYRSKDAVLDFYSLLKPFELHTVTFKIYELGQLCNFR